MHDTPIRLAIAGALIYAGFALACGSDDDSNGSDEPTLEEICARKCAVIADPDDNTDEEDRHPCVGETPPADCVSKCVDHIEGFEATGDDPEGCSRCVEDSTGWWGRRTVRKSATGLEIKTSCRHVRWYGNRTGGSTDVDFSTCTPSATCEGFVFPQPADGSWCGPYCGYGLTEVPDAGGASDVGSPADMPSDG